MIALLLAAQLSAQAPLADPHAQLFDPPSQTRAGDIIRTLPAKSACAGAAGRMEVSLAQPAALYRHGDRPAKVFGYWAAYPDGHLCLTETGR
ncbi:hypothetical protein [Phenylobacterium sp.]|uniref:hypothetical protein n=1 Tax=Phenylobacterium sp. TaxID=1871053 RepID=UPI001221AC74|nr:hypothetical protein [Phenylobacterium sp.]THD57759.1 MAG: hypothetical protein E8A49_21360 [Phenylobacterium sp.]